MKRFLHLLAGVSIWISFVGVGGAFVYANLPFGHAVCVLEPSANRWMGLGIGALMVLVSLLHLFTFAPRRKKTKTISFDTEGGIVSISVNAVCDFIQKLGDEFESVKNIDPKLHSEKDMVSIELNLKVRTGTRIPELSAQLQNRVRESVREGLGIVDVHEIKINISEIVGNPPPPIELDGEKDPDESTHQR